MKSENCGCQENEKPDGGFREKFNKSLIFMIVGSVPIIIFFGVVVALQFQEQRNLRVEVNQIILF